MTIVENDAPVSFLQKLQWQFPMSLIWLSISYWTALHWHEPETLSDLDDSVNIAGSGEDDDKELPDTDDVIDPTTYYRSSDEEEVVFGSSSDEGSQPSQGDESFDSTASSDREPPIDPNETIVGLEEDEDDIDIDSDE